MPKMIMPDLSITSDIVLQLGDAHVFVVGDVMLDKYLSGAVERVSPEAPVPVLLAGDERASLGGAANVAANIVALGGRAVVCGLYGDDIDGAHLERQCDAAGVSLETSLRRPGVSTIVKQRVVSRSQQLLRIDWERYQPADQDMVNAVVSRLGDLAGAGMINAVVISDYAKGMVTRDMARAVIRKARNLGLPVVVDPKGTVLDHYSGATVMKPNLSEARRLTSGVIDQPETATVDQLLRALHSLVSVDNIVMSMAAEGVAVSDSSRVVSRYRSHAVDVADVSGAGDTMVASLAAGLGTGLSIHAAVETGNIAAGLACARFGTSVITSEDLAGEIALLSLPAETPHIVEDWERLSHLVELRRRGGNRIVFTNGCFDLLHRGHIALLEEARRQGDILIVGLNSDDSVRRLKGPKRPLQLLTDRLRVMAAVRFVDYVTVFRQDTPLELIKQLRPDVIVKGGDYTAEEVVGGTEAKEWNGGVHIVPIVGNLSSSRLAESGSN
jgi:D-beta-D-heptose 7-phosphate kinase / D-beta-D-heptose 1-phosphate adenosyltransferase